MLFKRLYVGFVLAVISIGLVGCGNATGSKEDASNDTATEIITPGTETDTIVETDPGFAAEGYASMFESSLAQFRLPAIGDTVVSIVTNYGTIDILLFPEAAPKAVENFVTHAHDDYYDGIIFHRVIEDFMLQGGDPTGTGRGGESIWGDSFEDEFSVDYFPLRGALAMANAGPMTNGSQFFIVQSDVYYDQFDAAMAEYGISEEMIEAHKTLGGTPHLFNKHTVFGQVVRGMAVVDAIAAVEVGSGDKPVQDVVIDDVIVTVIE